MKKNRCNIWKKPIETTLETIITFSIIGIVYYMNIWARKPKQSTAEAYNMLICQSIF